MFPTFARRSVHMDDVVAVRQTIRKVQTELDTAFPDAQSLALLIEQGVPPLAPIELRIYGSDLQTLDELGKTARAIMSRVPGIIHSRPTLLVGRPKLRFELRDEAVRLVGLSNKQIAQQLAAGLDGTVGGSYREATEELPVRVRFQQTHRSGEDQVASMVLLTSRADANSGTANATPISALGEISLVAQTANIPRRNGRRCNIIQGYVTAGLLPIEVESELKHAMEEADFQVPLGYSLEFGGVSAKRNAAVGRLATYFAVLATLMMATLVLTFRSFQLAGVIAVVALLTIGFGMSSLWLFGFPFGIMAIIGMMGMMGVAINDAIVVLSAISEDSDAQRGDLSAVFTVVVGSTRHVLSTSITTFAGFLPLILAGGDFWPPVAIVIAGGVAGATLLALCFVPAAYLLIVRRALPRTSR